MPQSLELLQILLSSVPSFVTKLCNDFERKVSSSETRLVVENTVPGEGLRWAGEGGASTGQKPAAKKTSAGPGGQLISGGSVQGEGVLSSTAGCVSLSNTKAINGLLFYIVPKVYIPSTTVACTNLHQSLKGME